MKQLKMLVKLNSIDKLLKCDAHKIIVIFKPGHTLKIEF